MTIVTYIPPNIFSFLWTTTFIQHMTQMKWWATTIIQHISSNWNYLESTRIFLKIETNEVTMTKKQKSADLYNLHLYKT